MRKYLNFFEHKLQTLDDSDGESAQLRKATLTSNRFSIIVLLAIGLSLLLDIKNGFYEIITLKIICMAIIPIAIYFNTPSYWYMGKYVLVTVFTGFTFYLDNYFGIESGVYFYYFLTPISIPFIFTKKEWVGFVYAYVLFCVLAGLSIHYHHSLFINQAISHATKLELHRDNFIIAGLIMLFYGYVVANVHNRFETQLQEEHTKLVENEAQLKKINSHKDRILTIVAHDLRNPINAILSIVELLKATHKNNVPADELAKIHETIEEACLHGLDIISTLVEAEKISTGKYQLKMQKIAAGEWAEKLVKRHSYSAQKKGIEIHKATPQNFEFCTDTIVLNGILENFLSNAIKFTPAYGSVYFRVMKNNSHITFEVEDTGIGISEKNLPHIFEPFTKIKRPGTDGEKTIGMGMYIAQSWAKLLSAEIFVDSTLGKGTKFLLKLPL